ncbi:paired amphipathic helix protein Sin3-like 4 [Apium graveolens]|uniref:paired amphipathic helix protein Sin3-like 4 n=1 Tax=Apium graveolens TaxID=4045 RepID=UPI003D7985F7
MDAHLQDQPQFSDDSIESEITYQEQDSRPIEALQYVLSVKNTFGENSEDYLHFLALLKAFRAARISVPVVISRIKLLFSEHQELIEGFNQFLPEEFRITLPLTRRSDTNWEKPISFVNKVKAAFSQESERYVSFLQLLTGYQEAGMSLQGLSEQMSELLSDRQDLLEEFFEFLPSRRETSQSAASNSAASKRAAANSATIKGSFTTLKMKPAFLLGVALSVLVALAVGYAVRIGV